MSSSVTASSLFQGVERVVAGANPALTDGRGRRATAHQEQFGVQYLAQGHFNM